MLTGDFVFVSDVGRPDLLERAANEAGHEGGERAPALPVAQPHPQAPRLPADLARPRRRQRVRQGARRHAVIDRRLRAHDELGALASAMSEAFVERVLDGQPEPPAYFGVMKRMNRDGPPLLGVREEPPSPPPDSLAELGLAGALVVDVRAPDRFARAHVPGTLNIPVGRIVHDARRLAAPVRSRSLSARRQSRRTRSPPARALTLIGLDRVAGIFNEDACIAWVDGGRALGRIRQFTPEVLLEQARGEGGDAHRRALEERSGTRGTIATRSTFRSGELPRALATLPRDRPIAVYCQRGSRSAVAASLLSAAGIEAVNVPAGWVGIEAAQRQAERRTRSAHRALREAAKAERPEDRDDDDQRAAHGAQIHVRHARREHAAHPLRDVDERIDRAPRTSSPETRTDSATDSTRSRRRSLARRSR